MAGMRGLGAVLASSLFLLSGCAPEVVVRKRPEAGRRNRVAVLPFRPAPGFPSSGDIATEAFAAQLLQVQAYEVVERSALEVLLKEQKLGASGAVDPFQAVEIGKLAGADAVVTGSVTEFNPRNFLMLPPAKVAVTVRMIDTRTGEVAWSAQHGAGGAKRWLTLIVWPAWIVATVVSPSAEDLLQKTTKGICDHLSVVLSPQPYH